MADGRKMGRDELAKRLSQWSRLNMGYEISSEALLQLLHSPQTMKTWAYVLTKVKSSSPLDSLHFKVDEMFKPASPELVSGYEHLCEENASLDLEIADLQKNIEVYSDILTAKNEKMKQLQSEVFTHPSRMQLMSGFCSLQESNIQDIDKLIRKIETALDELPGSTPCNGSNKNDNVELMVNIQEAFGLINRYYLAARENTGSEVADKLRRMVHAKISEMVKLYPSGQYLETLISEIDVQKQEIEKSVKDASDLKMIKKRMESGFKDLREAHIKSFTTVQALGNRIEVLRAQKTELEDQLKEHLACVSDRSYLEELCEANLRLVRKEQTIKCLSEFKVPDGLSSLSLQEVQHVKEQIRNEQEATDNTCLQIAKKRFSNKKILDSLPVEIQEASSSLEKQILEARAQCADFDLENFNQTLENFADLLSELRTCEWAIDELRVRPGHRIMSSREVNDLQSALGMPPHEAPEMVGLRVQRLMERSWDNRGTSRILSHLVDATDSLEDTKQDFLRIYKSVEKSNMKADSVIQKAKSVTCHINSVTTCEELKQGLNDLKEQPAFNDNVL